jgi:hypothetical protein
MAQRGITGRMIDVVLEHGRQDQDKIVLDRKGAQHLLDEMRGKEAVLKKIIDKGGLVVVSDSNALITTYNYNGRR